MLIYKYRKKKTVIQYQINDFLGKYSRIIFDMGNPKQYQKAKLTMNPQKPAKPRGRPAILGIKVFLPLEHYFIHNQKHSKNPNYLLRFRILNLRYPFFNQMPLLPAEQILYTEILGFQGYFEDIFLFNPIFSQYIDQINTELFDQGIRFPHHLYDYFIFEMARIHTGNESYRGFLRNLSFFNPKALNSLLKDPQFIPIVQDFSEFFHSIPLESIYDIFYQILSEFYTLHLITFRILIWDCQFIHSNSKDFKVPYKNYYSDRDAGIGRHQNKFLGIGYMASTLYLYCGDLVIPVFCMIFPANINDKEIFKTTMKGYFLRGLPAPYIILGDAGAYSVQNLRYLAKNGIIGLINAPKNIVNQNVVTLRDNVHINRDFIPKDWTNAEILTIYDLRTEIERRFSHNVQIYHIKEINIRGIEQTAKHRFIVLILDLLKELTAIKLGRLDLLGKYSAFSLLRSGDSIQNYLQTLRKKGFQIFELEQGKICYRPKFAISNHN